MNKSIWAMLGIEPTTDKKAIRRAYAAQSKLHHPEEEPEYFAALNEAYRIAQQQAESPKTAQVSIRIQQPERNQQSRQQILPPKAFAQQLEESLLDRLERAEAEKMRESFQQGALGELTRIFEDGKRRNKAEVWKDYFLSASFLAEQYRDEFAKGLLQYLQNQTIAAYNNLPQAFVTELAVAYALYPESIGMHEWVQQSTPSSEEIMREVEIFRVEASGSFYARTAAAEIWNAQTADYDKYGFSRLYKSLNREDRLVRLRSFDTYHRLVNMNEKGYLTPRESKIWEDMLYGITNDFLYEINGHTVDQYTRSECLITLITYWITSVQVPECVLKYLYKQLNLKNVEGSMNRVRYKPLKQAIIQQFPQIEIVLFGKNDNTKRIHTWYKQLMKIVDDNHSNYDKGIYEDTENIRMRCEALFLSPEWEKIRYEQALFDQLFERLADRRVIPQTLVHRLSEFYSKPEDFETPDKVVIMTEGLLRSLGFMKRMREMDYRTVSMYEKTDVSDIGDDNLDFWAYFIMWGFGNRCIPAPYDDERKLPYIVDNTYYLTGYMQELYYPYLAENHEWNPAVEWQKRFTHFDEEQNAIPAPVSTVFVMPDNRELRVEFHLHYCLYFLDGQQVIEPVMTFSELKELAAKTQRLEEIFFMLAITKITDRERLEAEKMIGGWLKGSPLYPATQVMIAKMLAADNAREEVPENPAKRIVAEVYGEQERFCFKMTVSQRAVKLYRQTRIGWEEMTLLDGEGKKAKLLDIDGKILFAKEKLAQMMQPQPQKIASYDLNGMTNEQKAAQIIEAMKEAEQHRKQRQVPYVPGFPWQPEEISPAVRTFFAKDGGWMLESYCVLHYGNRTEHRFERLFYCVMNIFGFDLFFQSPEMMKNLNMSISMMHRKIKENHLVVGYVGWGKSYSPKTMFDPQAFAIGESGTFYMDDWMRMHQTDSLAALLAVMLGGKRYNLEDVTSVDIFAGRMSVSRFDHQVEYCYTQQDYQNWLDSKTKTLPDVFTKFGK